MVGILIAALLPLVWLMPALHAHAPFARAAWQTQLPAFALGLMPIARGLSAACALVPIGPLPLRESLGVALALCAVSAAAYACVERALRRAPFLTASLRVPIAIGAAWMLVSRALIAEPVLVRLAAWAPALALALACVAIHIELSRTMWPLHAAVTLIVLWSLALIEQPLCALAIAPVLIAPVRLLRAGAPQAELLRRAAIARAQHDAARAKNKPARPLALAAAVTFMALGGAALRDGTSAVAAIHSEAFDALRDALLHDAPPRSVLVLHPAIAEPLYRSRGALQLRADLRFIPSEGLLQPRMAEGLALAHPELKALVRATLLRGQLDAVELQALAAQRAVRLAPGPGDFESVREALLPSALGFDVTTSSSTSTDLKAAWAAALPVRERLFAELDPLHLDRDTRAFVREQCVLAAALVGGLARGSLLNELLDLAASFAIDAAEREQLAATLGNAGIPPGAFPLTR